MRLSHKLHTAIVLKPAVSRQISIGDHCSLGKLGTADTDRRRVLSHSSVTASTRVLNAIADDLIAAIEFSVECLHGFTGRGAWFVKAAYNTENCLLDFVCAHRLGQAAQAIDWSKSLSVPSIRGSL